MISCRLLQDTKALYQLFHFGFHASDFIFNETPHKVLPNALEAEWMKTFPIYCGDISMNTFRQENSNTVCLDFRFHSFLANLSSVFLGCKYSISVAKHFLYFQLEFKNNVYFDFVSLILQEPCNKIKPHTKLWCLSHSSQSLT